MATVKEFYNSFNFQEMVLGNKAGKPPPLLQEFFQRDLDYIAEHFTAEKDVLEVGCGFGRLLPKLAERSKKVTGIDFSDLQIAQAQETARNLKNVSLLKMCAESLEFPPASFDISLCMNCSLGNMPDIEEKVVEEMIRVTKPGGEIVIRVFADTKEVREAQCQNYRRLGLTNIRDKGAAIVTGEGFYSRRFTESEMRALFQKTEITPAITHDCEAGYLITAHT